VPTTSWRPPSAPATASARNRREAAVVDWLIDRLAIRLGDRSGARHAPPWEPKQNVLIGVLDPIRIRPPKTDDARVGKEGDQPTVADGATGAEKGSSVEPETAQTPIGEIPSLGLDFRLHAPDEGKVTLEIDTSFTIYLEEIATLAEQRQYLGVTADPGTCAADSPAANGSSSIDGKRHVDEMSVDGSRDQPSAAEEDASGATNNKADEREPKGRRRARKTRLLGAWRRYEVAPGSFKISVPLDGTVLTTQTPLLAPLQAVIDAHFAQPNAMRPFRGARNELPPEALKDESALQCAVEAALDREWAPSYPQLELTAFAQPLGGGEYLISVSLRNMTILTERTLQDLSVYDCQLQVHTVPPVRIVPQRFELAPDDYRLRSLGDVIGRGTACVAVATDRGGIRSETLPTHIHQVIEPRGDHVRSPRWSELAKDPREILASVQTAMQDYELTFQRFVDTVVGQPHHAAAAKGLAQFRDELRRFRLGRDVLQRDPRLRQAFKLANEVFALANKGHSFDTWRLFQLVYIVTHLPALAAREHTDPELRRELDHVDVLWFPAGGGKTEAYLGLIVTALFYDRLRGKDAGVTAWLRFPLRMLSVQQLFRMLRVLVIAEDLRHARGIGDATADPFALGYLVGSRNTPNQLAWDSGWWKGWTIEAARAAKGCFEEDHEEDRLVTRCPYCQRDTVQLTLNVDQVRILHVCRACYKELPLYMSDEEVYRYLPSVVISTVDKLTGYTWFSEFTAFSHGPQYRCPDHGYFSFPFQGTCSVGKDLCSPPKRGHPKARRFKDPVPALTVQDEMHLLKEELGAFSGHYEGLIAELQRGGPSTLPSKILAASATIEQFEDQLRQIYGRIPRAFPSAGFELLESFYVQQTDKVRRTFLGILPHYRRKADVAAIVQAELLRAVTELQDDPDPLSHLAVDSAWWPAPPSREDALDLLFDYEVSLGYVNSKAHGAKLDEELRLLSDQLDNEGRGAVDRVVLTGQVPIPDLADAINRVQSEQRTLERAKRLRAMVGTSVVSHGVDLDRLNVLVMAGMPTTAADYIQVTARSGRTHAGLVVTVYDSFSRRERSLFGNFASYHLFLDQMVMPVPVNKYAFFVAARTVPGIVLALLHDLARDPALGAPATGVKSAKDFQSWWNTSRTKIDAALRPRLRRCYATPLAGVNDVGMEDELANRAMTQWGDVESRALSRPMQEKQTAMLFHNKPLANFRDIDDPAEFQVFYPSKDAFEAVTGRRTADTEDEE
jgi:hypothetical protein